MRESTKGMGMLLTLLLTFTASTYALQAGLGSVCDDDNILKLDYQYLASDYASGYINIRYCDDIYSAEKFRLDIFSKKDSMKPNISAMYLTPNFRIRLMYLLEEWSYVSVTAYYGTSPCSPKNVRYNIHHLITILRVRPGGDSCIPFPNEQSQLVWPLDTNFNENCICSIDELQFVECQCLKSTEYSITITNKKVCFNGIKLTMNNTAIYFQQTEDCGDKDCEKITISQGFKFMIPQNFTFNYSSFEFRNGFAKIAWNPATQCDGEVFYYLVTTGNTANKEMLNGMTETSIRYLNDAKYYVEAVVGNDTCTLSRSSLEISQEVTTVPVEVIPNKEKCIQPMHSSSVVILPTHVDGQDGHCFCDNWLLIKDCSCLGDIADYNVYNPEKSLPVELCFSNVTNNTMIQMVYQTYNIFTNTPTEFFPLYNELFMESYHFITIGLPSPPNVINHIKTNLSLCFEDSYDHQRVQYYKFSVIDITGFISSYTVNKNESTCKTLFVDADDVLATNCGSLNITSTSHNEIGSSQQRSEIIKIDGQEDICGCFNQNVRLSINFDHKADDNQVMVNLSCETTYNDFNGTNIVLEISQSNITSYGTKLNCSSSITIDEKEFLEDSIATIKWISNEGVECCLQKQNVGSMTKKVTSILCAFLQILIVIVGSIAFCIFLYVSA